MIGYPKTSTAIRRGLLCAFLILALFIPATLEAAEGDTWIVFDCNRSGASGYWDIWKLDPDGDGSQWNDSLFGTALTKDPANEWDPTYSKEDKRGTKQGAVVFVSDKDGYPHLYKISIDGESYWWHLASGPGDPWADVDPCYSFDGKKIAFASNRTGNWEIYTMTSDGQDVTRITQSFSDNRSPCFSKDGSKIYFIGNRDTGAIGDWEIYVVNSSGGTPSKAIVNSSGQPLLLDYTEHDPCCSPTDPNIIVFTTNVATPTYGEHLSEVDRINFELFSYNFVTKDTNRLTDSWNEYWSSKDSKWVPQLWNSSMPCFSPDGERIAWSADNWTGLTWQPDNYPDGPYNPSYWKPNGGQGSVHQIWTRRLDQPDHHYWFPPSYWGYLEGEGPWPWPPGHQHHKHYNPSWDEQS